MSAGTNTRMNNTEPVLSPRRATLFGPLILVAGVAIGSITIYDGVTSGSVLTIIAGLVLGGWFVAGGQMLAAPRGGVWAGPTELRLGGDGMDDGLTVPVARVRGLLVHLQRETVGELTHASTVCDAILDNGVRVLVAEGDDGHEVRHVAAQLAQGTGLEVLSEPPEAAESTEALLDARLTVRVGAGGRNARVLLLTALVLLPLSVVLFMDVVNNNVIGFLIAPFLGATGLALGLVPVAKWLTQEELAVVEGAFEHAHFIFGRGFNAVRLPLGPGAHVRLRQRGLLGVGLEIITATDGTIRATTGGIHCGTSVSTRDALDLAARVQRMITPHAD